MGVDGYDKISRNLIDEGQFVFALIFHRLTTPNEINMVPRSRRTTPKEALTPMPISVSNAEPAKNIVSGQFLFGPDELAFIRNHWVFLDHDQRYTLSAGASYTFKDTTVYADILYGTGREAALRTRMSCRGTIQ